MAFSNQRCSSQQTISKTTVLAFLQANKLQSFKVGQTVNYTDSNHMVSQYRIDSISGNQVTLSNKTSQITADISKIQSLNPPTLFDKLQDNEWSIVSFDSKTGQVCIRIQAAVPLTVSVTLPVVRSRVF